MRVLSLFGVDWYQECFGVAVDSPRQSTVYNRYATLFFANPVFLGFSRYLNVNFGSQRDNFRVGYVPCDSEYKRLRPCFAWSGAFLYSTLPPCRGCSKVPWCNDFFKK